MEGEMGRPSGPNASRADAQRVPAQREGLTEPGSPPPDGAEEDLAARLRERAALSPEFWSFSGRSRREGGHGIFAYPAMMVPQLQGALLEDVQAVDPTVSTVLDPFMGSGTVMLESARRGLSFHGTDINPLAVLLATVKSHIYDPELLARVRQRIAVRVIEDESREIIVHFTNRDKWFRDDVAIDLSKLKRAISVERPRVVRQAFWVALAETIRLVSNSRTSTVKLHSYRPEEIQARQLNAIDTFLRISASQIEQLEDQAVVLAQGLDMNPSLSITCTVADARSAAGAKYRATADILMTSPPYGDNVTTVTYGQHSYLPLQWIDSADVPGMRQELLEYTRSIDSISLGGKLKGSLDWADELRVKSAAFAQCLDQLHGHPRNAQTRMVAFIRDLDESLDAIVSRLRSNSWMFWTLGERKISGVRVPTVAIVRDLLAARGARHVETLERKIPGGSKRMAARNASVETMNSESVLVMRGPCDNHCDSRS
ncbi:site-specific DNA-methyltransferase [Streptomyces anthocyanicus]|uniref:site-specific DNA-methyltransferase n=1 Tax=Streptomyces sp. OM5714 TaxID=2602736 RepID=UPI0013DD779E|nr:site-specific DNA-methyltransferase [Streptomyces sp. OM5714]